MSISSVDSLDFTIESEKRDIPTEIKKIIHRYTSWETMEDVGKAVEKYRFPKEKFYIKDLEGELEKMEGLHSDLKVYDRDCTKSLDDAVDITKRQIFDKFPGIQNMEEYNRLGYEYWVAAILHERTVNDTADDYYDSDCKCRWRRPRFSLSTLAYGGELYRSCSFPVLETDEDVELRLSELYEELGTNRSKVLEAHNLWMTLGILLRSVEYSIIGNIKKEVEYLRNQMRRDERLNGEERWRKECEDKLEEARKLTKEKLQNLCSVMKEVLGDIVENVDVSFEYYSSSCFLRDSGMGGKIMEIQANDSVIQDLRKRSDTDKNDIHVRNSTLLLFSYAELHYKTMQQEQQTD